MREVSFQRSFYFLRHGETDWNRQGRTQGQIDTPLNALGRAQAGAAAARLAGAPIARIVSSPLIRARETAETVAAALGAPVSCDPDLMEAHMGVMQGCEHDATNPLYWSGQHAPKGGESFAAFCDRVIPAMARISALAPDTLIVAHGGLWYALAPFLRDSPTRDMPNAIPFHLSPGEDGLGAEALMDFEEAAVIGDGGERG